MKTLISIALLFCNVAMAGECAGFLPKNNLRIPMSSKALGISEKDFNRQLDLLEQNWSQVVKDRGATLKVNRLWSDGTVNSDASQQGKTWTINSYGGLARYKGMTADGYLAVACHELGHHIGGAPRFSDFGNEWASIEGEADYFATLKCLKKIWAADDNETAVGKPREDISKKCGEKYTNRPDVALCEREEAASLVLAKILAELGGESVPSVSKPDPSEVSSTFEEHPQAQCRLDTYCGGSLCDAPGDLSDSDYKPGSCFDYQRKEPGVRPRCWFAP